MKKLFAFPLLLAAAAVLSACAAVPDATLARCRQGVAAALARPVGHDVLEVGTLDGEAMQTVVSSEGWFINDKAGIRSATLDYQGDTVTQTKVGQGDVYYVKRNPGDWQPSPGTRYVGVYGANFKEDFFTAKNFSAAQESSDTLTLTHSKTYLQSLQDEALAQLNDSMAYLREKFPEEDPAANGQIRKRQEFLIKNSPYRSGSFTLRFDAEGRIVEMVQTITQDIAQTAYVGEEEVVTGTQALTTQVVIRYETPALSEAEAVIDPLWQEASSG